MSKFINPFTDIGFKRIFGQEVSKPVLITFLNSLLEGEHRILDLTFLDKEQPGESLDDKSLIYDVYCETASGERIIVEMQNRFSRTSRTAASSIWRAPSPARVSQVRSGTMPT